MTEQEYLEDRLEDQIKWYDKKSQIHQKWYKKLKFIELISGFAIPIATLVRFSSFEVLVSILSGIILLSEGSIALFNHQNNWIEYRRTAENLKQEKYMYLTSSGVYNDLEDKFTLLVERVETLISSENINWANMERDKKEKN